MSLFSRLLPKSKPDTSCDDPYKSVEIDHLSWLSNEGLQDAILHTHAMVKTQTESATLDLLRNHLDRLLRIQSLRAELMPIGAITINKRSRRSEHGRERPLGRNEPLAKRSGDRACRGI